MLAARLRAVLAAATPSAASAATSSCCCALSSTARMARCMQRASAIAASRAAVRARPRSVHVSCCIGIALHVAGGRAAMRPALVRDADARDAQREGARAGRLCDLRRRAARRGARAPGHRGRRCATAIGAGELRVHYQPIVGLPGGVMRGVEALVRWQRPGVGLVPPLDVHPARRGERPDRRARQLGADTAMADVAGWQATACSIATSCCR